MLVTKLLQITRGDAIRWIPFEIRILGCANIKFVSLKLIYSEKATKFWEISTVDLTVTTNQRWTLGGDSANFFGPSQKTLTLSTK